MDLCGRISSEYIGVAKYYSDRVDRRNLGIPVDSLFPAPFAYRSTFSERIKRVYFSLVGIRGPKDVEVLN